MVWSGGARLGWEMHGTARLGGARKLRPGAVRQGNRGKVRSGQVWSGQVRSGTAGHGEARKNRHGPIVIRLARGNARFSQFSFYRR